MKFPEFELGDRRLIPALPEEDSELGEIRWDAWEEAPCLSHIPGNCATCEYPGPMRIAQGKTWYVPEPNLVRVRRSSWERGERSKWARRQGPSYWVYTHWATRCPHCDEMTVWRKAARLEDWVAIHYHAYTVERAVKPELGTLF